MVAGIIPSGLAAEIGVRKAGGLKLYRQIRPLFLGIVMGESIIVGIWITIGLPAKVDYSILPEYISLQELGEMAKTLQYPPFKSLVSIQAALTQPIVSG